MASRLSKTILDSFRLSEMQKQYTPLLQVKWPGDTTEIRLVEAS